VGVNEWPAAAAARVGLLRPDLPLQAFAETGAEARAVGTSVATVLTGPDATAERIRADSSRAGALHLAVPAMVSDASPLHGLLALQGPGGEASVIETAAVLDWTSPRLVVLSRATTDASPDESGAGVIAMAWAWKVAGADSLVMTDWPIDTPAFGGQMRAFHRRVQPPAGIRPTIAEAWRLAVIGSPRKPLPHPYHWANARVFRLGPER